MRPARGLGPSWSSGRVPAVSITQRGEGIVDPGNWVVADRGRLRARFIVPRRTLVHRLPSGKTVGRQGGATGFILHQNNAPTWY